MYCFFFSYFFVGFVGGDIRFRVRVSFGAYPHFIYFGEVRLCGNIGPKVPVLDRINQSG